MSSSSHNRNPGGNNQHGQVSKVDDPVLRKALEMYHRHGLTNNVQISETLLCEHNIKIPDTTIKHHQAELKLYGSCVTTRDMPHTEKVQLIIEQLDKDFSKQRGLADVKARIANEHGVHLLQDFISDIMHLHDPEGFEHRQPGARRILRVAKIPIGTHKHWAGDGHNKLYSIGFPIWAVVDDATMTWLDAWVVPTNRMGAVIAYLFILLIEKYGGMPLQFSTDCGSETTVLFGLANALCERFFPDVESIQLPPHLYMRSVHNISIEQSWLRLRLKWGDNAIACFNQGVADRVYTPHADAQHDELCKFLWSTLLCKELALFIELANHTRMRKNNEKAGPSGCSRYHAFLFPEKWGGHDCLLLLSDADKLELQVLKAHLLKDGPLLDFVTPEFAAHTESALNVLGIQELSFDNVWAIYSAMLPLVFPDL